MELDIVGAQRVRQFDDIDDALDELAAVANGVDEALRSARSERTLAARLSEHHDDGWIPTILLCAVPIDDHTFARLVKLSARVDAAPARL